MPKVRKFVDLIYLACLSAVTFFAFLTLSPAYESVPHRDSGIFLYIGSQILRGKVLYLQTWDHKQPLIYLLNALGLWIGGGSTWGVWGLELVLFITALILIYLLLRKALSPLFSFVVTATSFLTIYQIMSGNFSEEYAIFFQVTVLALLFLVYLPNRRRFSAPLSALTMGALTALSFCIKQTYVDVGLAVVVFMLFLAWLEKNKARIIHILWFVLGFLLINAGVVLYFYLHHALSEYIFGAFLFNVYYSHQGLLEWLHAVLQVTEFTSAYPFLFILGAIWLGSLVSLVVKSWPSLKILARKTAFRWVVLLLGIFVLALFLFAQIRGKSIGIGLVEWAVLLVGVALIILALSLFIRKGSAGISKGSTIRQQLLRFDWHQPGVVSFLFLGLLDLPVVVLTISLSGENFPHYYISLFIALFLLLSTAAIYLQGLLLNGPSKFTLNCIFIVTMLAGSFFPAMQVVTRLQAPAGGDARSATAAYLKSVTTPQEKILVWGYEAGIYFMADRESPTRYAIQVPAYYQSPEQQQVLVTLLKDIQANPPLYIADTVDPAMPFIQGKTTAECLQANPIDGDNLHAILNYVCSHYEFVKSFATINIYKRDL